MASRPNLNSQSAVLTQSSSVMSVHSNTPDMVRWTCGDGTARNFGGGATALYGGRNLKQQHHWDWLEGWTEAQANDKNENLGQACNRDEWPPRRFWPQNKKNQPGQRIRYSPGESNKGAAKMWTSFCEIHGEYDSKGNKNQKLHVIIESHTRVETHGQKSKHRFHSFLQTHQAQIQ